MIKEDLLTFEFTAKDEDGKTTREKPIIIIGPAESKHLRVYAYGGLIGRIPLAESKAEYHLADDDYKKSLDSNEAELLEKFLAWKRKQPAAPGLSPKKALVNTDYLNLICKAAQQRFSSKKKSRQERNIQVKIAKQSMDSSAENVVCDMEHCVQAAEYAQQCQKMPQYKGKKSKKPKFDLITIDRNGRIGFIELKINGNACRGGSGVREHYEDAQICMQSSFVKKRIKHRYNVLSENGIIEGAKIEETAAENSEDAFFGFLFHQGEKLTSQADAVRICEEELAGIDFGGEKIFFQFVARAEDVDFDHMQTWQEFCAGAGLK